MNQFSDIDVPHGDEVSTEPQRLALEAMSRDLVNKLNAMVAEQEQRAQEFARQQHSLSSLPTQTLPEISIPTLPEVNPTAVAQPTQPQVQGVYGRMSSPQAPVYPTPTITNGPSLPQVPRAVQQPRYTQHSSQQKSRNVGKDYRMPTVIRDTEADKKEGGLSAGTVFTIIIVLFILLIHGCD